MTLAFIAVIWLMAALLMWLAGQVEAFDGQTLRIGVAVVLVLLAIWSLQASGLLNGHIVRAY